MPENRRPLVIVFVLLIVVLSAGAWALSQTRAADRDDRLEASGTVEAVEVTVAPEMAGRIAEVFVAEGESVRAGQPLFRLEEDVLSAQLERAAAGLAAAQAGLRAAEDTLRAAEGSEAQAHTQVEAAEIGLEIARLRHQQTLQAARMREAPGRRTAWSIAQPDAFERPVWYYDDGESLLAADAQVEAAREALTAERERFQSLLAEAEFEDLAAAEARLAEAQAAFLVAESVLEQAADARDNPELEGHAEELRDAAEDELAAAQSEYDRLLTETDSEEVLEARARLSVARERYETALDRWQALLTGEDSLEVQLAAASVRQAEIGLAQAQTGLPSAQAAVGQAASGVESARAQVERARADLAVLELQMDKLVVTAAADGVVTVRSVQPGEVVQPGAVAMKIGQLAELTITVYVPEDRYGQIELGDQARVAVDSYPDRVFTATVTRIADRAEFTPRNVQTEEGRRTTVYAIELTVADPEDRLKPGMPADVTFDV